MHCLDANVLIYACVNQDDGKMKQSQDMIRELQNRNKLVLSPFKSSGVCVYTVKNKCS